MSIDLSSDGAIDVPDCPDHPDCDCPSSEPEEPIWHDGNTPDPDAENDPSLLDLETVCASCGMPHLTPGVERDCPCARHIDSPGETTCNAARPVPPSSAGSEVKDG